MLKFLALCVSVAALSALALTVNGASDGRNAKDGMLDLDKAMTECNESFRIEMSFIDSLNETGSFPDETDKTPKCFLRCVLEKVGITTDSGMYDPDRTVAVFRDDNSKKTEEEVRAVALGCAERQEMCKCERAYMYMKCLMEAAIESRKA